MNIYVLPNGEQYRVSDNDIDFFKEKYPNAQLQQNAATSLEQEQKNQPEQMTMFYGQDGDAFRVKQSDIEEFKKQNPGYMTKEEIEKQVADYKAAQRKYEQQRKELEAKKEEEQRIYEDRIKKGFIKHKGEELQPWYNRTESSRDELGQGYIDDNNLSIEDMEKYLNDNNFDYIIKGGKQDKGPGFGDMIESKLGSIAGVVDKFLGGHIGSFQELQGEYLAGQGRILIDNAREREIAEYAPDEYNKLRAQNYIQIKELEKETVFIRRKTVKNIINYKNK